MTNDGGWCQSVDASIVQPTPTFERHIDKVKTSIVARQLVYKFHSITDYGNDYGW